MNLRSIFPQVLFNVEDGGGAAAPVSSSAAGETPASVNAPAPDAGAVAPEVPKVENEPPKAPSLDDQLDSIWNNAHKPRDEKGRFASTKPPSEEEGGDEQVSAEGEESLSGEETDQPAGNEQTPDPKEATVEMPKSWSKDDAETWASLPPAAKERILQRETETMQALSRAGREVSAFRNARPVLDAIAPHSEYLAAVGQQLGQHPANLINGVLNFERSLRTAPTNEAKIGILGQIAAEYGIDLTPLAGPDAARILSEHRAPAPDPRIDAILARQQEWDRRFAEQQRAEEASAQKQMADTVKAFETNTKEYPYFAAVKQEMSAILQTLEDGDRPANELLKEAYEKACYLNPQIREKVIADRIAAEEAKRLESKRTKASAAQSAAATNLKSGVPSTPKRSIDDDLASVAAKHYG